MLVNLSHSPIAAIRMTQLRFGGARSLSFFFLPLATVFICPEPICGGIDELPAPGGEGNTKLDQFVYGGAAGRSWKH